MCGAADGWLVSRKPDDSNEELQAGLIVSTCPKLLFTGILQAPEFSYLFIAYRYDVEKPSMVVEMQGNMESIHILIHIYGIYFKKVLTIITGILGYL